MRTPSTLFSLLFPPLAVAIAAILFSFISSLISPPSVKISITHLNPFPPTISQFSK
ncbi:hypothetical protein Goari_025640 [Gossypium aridum]|uniref:Uncharacterized protein n=1 Tax=Gossypium aridum TaxID=34290 RepID=A0A7J8X9P8_GOSAI|nr:hypothetical protein [Gossypium aridum]